MGCQAVSFAWQSIGIAGAPGVSVTAGMSDRTAAHPTILIIDFGSQVTQLIARRVREAGVYSEIVPFDKASEALRPAAARRA